MSEDRVVELRHPETFKEGFSIPAQCKLLRDYAAQTGFKIVEEYIDVETAKSTGRTNFGEMVKYLRKHPGVLVEKAEQGIWPSKAPLGYLNVTAKDGKKIIKPDPALAAMVTKLFERYATGHYSLKALTKAAHADGFVHPKSGNRVPVSTVHAILRNRLYSGMFEWNGKLHQGRHEPLVSIELWERVQGVLTGRNTTPIHSYGREFAFSGLMKCADCGCAWRKSRRASTSIITAPAMPTAIAAIRPTAGANMCARRRWRRNSRRCWIGSISTKKCWNGCARR